MTQEEKDLLIKDLCARLPYVVMVNAQYKDGEGWKSEDRKVLGIYEDRQVYLDCVYTTIENVKPYLRPMSSMTEEEKKEWVQLRVDVNKYIEGYHVVVDFYNKHHFDYRCLIDMELALPAPDGMYK